MRQIVVVSQVYVQNEAVVLDDDLSEKGYTLACLSDRRRKFFERFVNTLSTE